jgi:PAS domain S-box-containing protein
MQKILVSEDSIIVNQHICKTLEGSGFEVFSAFSGKEAVEKAKEHQPDLILMDIMMETKSDGIEAAMEVSKLMETPIIFLTALTDEGTLNKVKESQPYGYIVKPFNEVELLSNIQVAIHKSQAEKEVKNNYELFQAAINSMDQAFMILDEDERLFYCNTGTEQLLNRKFEQIINQPIEDFLKLRPAKEKSTLSLGQLQSMDSVERFHAEFMLNHGANERPVGELSVKKVEAKNASTYTLLLFKDISDRFKARELEKELEKKRMASLIEGQENERSRLALEIHDGIGQMINLIKMKTKVLPESEAKAELEPLLEQTLEEVRNITENLHPSQLSDFPLEKNIEKLVKQFESHSDMQFDFTAKDMPELDLSTKTHLFRITQEALTNIIKHAKAKESTIQLYGLDNKIQLTIEDDGVGYQSYEKDQDAHHGLQNISYRVSSMNGEFSVDSSAKNGTLLLVTIPLNP